MYMGVKDCVTYPTNPTNECDLWTNWVLRVQAILLAVISFSQSHSEGAP